MEIKYELGILRRNLADAVDNHTATIQQQTLKLNGIKGDHIQELQQLTKDSENERTWIIKRQMQEVNAMSAEHIRALQRLSREVKQFTKRVDDFCKLVEHYSHFDSKEIGELLAEIMSTLKGEEYIYQDTLRYTAKMGKAGKRIPLVIPYRIIIEKKLAHDSYLDDNINLDGLIEGNMALILDKGSKERQICFYRANEKEHSLIPLIQSKATSLFEGFPVNGYVIIEEFIDFLISYKMENKLESIPSDKMNQLKEGFIKAKQNIDGKGQLVK